MQFRFETEKGVVCVHYLIQNIHRPSPSRIFKLLYLADKTCLESYGRSLCGEAYEARADGPVPRTISKWIVRDKKNREYGFDVIVDSVGINLSREPDLDELSDSDITCLDQTIELFGTAPMWWLMEISKDSAYMAAWRYSSDPACPINIESIVALLELPTELLEHIRTGPHIERA